MLYAVLMLPNSFSCMGFWRRIFGRTILARAKNMFNTNLTPTRLWPRDASQMFLNAQDAPNTSPDVSQMALDASVCFQMPHQMPDASQMSPRCLPDASKMLSKWQSAG